MVKCEKNVCDEESDSMCMNEVQWCVHVVCA